MSDIRARLADALREHYLWPESQDGSDHLADVLLSLPGIAIVDEQEIETIRTAAMVLAGHMGGELSRQLSALVAAANKAEETP